MLLTIYIPMLLPVLSKTVLLKMTHIYPDVTSTLINSLAENMILKHANRCPCPQLCQYFSSSKPTESRPLSIAELLEQAKTPLPNIKSATVSDRRRISPAKCRLPSKTAGFKITKIHSNVASTLKNNNMLKNTNIA
jgi:hypothetical protein